MISGIDGAGGPPVLPPPPLIIAKIAASGALEELGNRFVVSGTTFQVSDTTSILIDGQTNSDDSMLSSGQVAVVRAHVDELNNAIAKEIIVTTQVSGAISHITDKSITVLKHIIILHDDIVFGGSAKQFPDLKDGDVVNVSGFRLSDGNFSAIRIDRVETSLEKITGSISQVNDSEKIFFINDLAINYSQVAGSFEPKEGDTVNVTGTVNNHNQSVLDALSINIAHQF